VGAKEGKKKNTHENKKKKEKERGAGKEIAARGNLNMIEWKSKAINRAFSITKPFHPTNKTTAFCKSEFMNLPHPTKLDREYQTGDSIYVYS